MELNELIGDTKAFINITESRLLSGHCTVLPPERVVVELLEDIKPTPEVIEATMAVKDLRAMIALDDVVTTEGYGPLIELADIVKVEFMLTEPHQRRTLIQELTKNGIKVLAENVENHGEFNEAMSQGRHYFQGLFF